MTRKPTCRRCKELERKLEHARCALKVIVWCRVIDWRDQSDDGLRLRCGELTAREIRTIRAVLNAILPANAQAHVPTGAERKEVT
jgi:hypothetical protein